MTDDPTCHVCELPYGLLPGCVSPLAERWSLPHDGHGQDLPCRDCRAHPGAFHHPGCCVGRCPNGDGEDQALGCGCDEHEALAEQIWPPCTCELCEAGIDTDWADG